MANIAFISALSLTFFCILISQCLLIPAAEQFGESLNPKRLGLKKEKLTHFRGYYQEVVQGANASTVLVVNPPSNTSATLFGGISMIDNRFTIGPEKNSTLVGRVQGLYGYSSQTQLSYIMAMNLVFLEGKYNGSTVTILGRNLAALDEREMPIVGGSGRFQFARGYVLLKTTLVDLATGDVTLEFNIYVLHY